MPYWFVQKVELKWRHVPRVYNPVHMYLRLTNLLFKRKKNLLWHIPALFQKDFRVQELPLARIKKIMKLDEDVKVRATGSAKYIYIKAPSCHIHSPVHLCPERTDKYLSLFNLIPFPIKIRQPSRVFLSCPVQRTVYLVVKARPVWEACIQCRVVFTCLK